MIISVNNFERTVTVTVVMPIRCQSAWSKKRENFRKRARSEKN